MCDLPLVLSSVFSNSNSVFFTPWVSTGGFLITFLRLSTHHCLTSSRIFCLLPTISILMPFLSLSHYRSLSLPVWLFLTLLKLMCSLALNWSLFPLFSLSLSLISFPLPVFLCPCLPPISALPSLPLSIHPCIKPWLKDWESAQAPSQGPHSSVKSPRHQPAHSKKRTEGFIHIQIKPWPWTWVSIVLCFSSGVFLSMELSTQV